MSKIVINTRFLLPSKLEGMGWFTYEIAKRWSQWYPEHEFYFLFDRPFDEQFIFADNVRPIVVGPPARHPILFYLWFEHRLPAIFKKIRADLFMSPDGFISLASDIPTLNVIHDIAWKHFPDQIPLAHLWYYRYFMPAYAKKSTHIATVSAYSKADICQHLQVDPSKVTVVYDGAAEGYQPLSLEERVKIEDQYSRGCPYFLYLGSIHPRKNIMGLLRAFEIFKSQTENTYKLLLAGRLAWQNGPIQEELQKMKYANDVIFLGYTDAKDLYKIVASAQALTYVSLFEGFGIPILEAMYCDVPSIASSTSSMPEVVGKAGILVDPYSSESIAKGMIQMANDDLFRQACIVEGREQRKQYSWDLTAQKMWAALEHTAGFKKS